MYLVDIGSIDYSTLSNEDLCSVMRSAEEELKAREALVETEQKVVELQEKFLKVRDRDVPESDVPNWIQPTGAHDVYPKGFIVRHDGKIWVNQHPMNSWEPGTTNSQWIQSVIPEPENEAGIPEWGVGQEVTLGDLRVYEGTVWSAVIGHVTHEGWAPSQFTHAVWSFLGPLEEYIDDTEPEDQPVEPVDPPVEPEDPPVDPEPEQPARPAGYVGTWSPSASYKVNDIVDKDGSYWKCLVAHGAEYQGTWAPGVAHAAWSNVGTV